MKRTVLACLLPAVFAAATLGSNVSTPMSTDALDSTTGGLRPVCAAIAGFGLGLGISGLFGCVPCGVVGVGIDLGVGAADYIFDAC
jgi:hypothetical protein